jgi:hypothetical protein
MGQRKATEKEEPGNRRMQVFFVLCQRKAGELPSLQEVTASYDTGKM